jgi:RHS repeat-associated protein
MPDRIPPVTAVGSTTYTAFGQGNTEQLARETLAGGVQRNYTRTGTGEAVSTRFGAGSKYYYIHDALGSVIGLFDKAGAYAGRYSYSPYGETRDAITAGSAADSNSLRYISGYFDRGSGLYKLGARFYDPALGRFTRYDPSGQEANPYSYAGCNPINNSDPTGLSCISEFLLAAGATLLLAAEIVGTIALAIAPEPVITKAGAVGIALTLAGTTAVATGAILQVVGCFTGTDL